MNSSEIVSACEINDLLLRIRELEALFNPAAIEALVDTLAAVAIRLEALENKANGGSNAG